MLMRILFFIVALLLPVQSWADIAFDAVTDSALMTGSVTSRTVASVPVAAGDNRILLACVQISSDSADVPSLVTGITFNTTETFTFIRKDEHHPGNAWATELWYRLAPTVTTADVVVTVDDTDNSRVFGATVVGLTGVDQTSPIDAQGGGVGNGTEPLSAIVTTVAANAWIVDCAVGRLDTGLTVGAGQTVRTDRIGGTNVEGLGVSTVDGKASPGAETMDWTQGVAEIWAMSAVSLKPAGAAAPACRGGLLLLGVGC